MERRGLREGWLGTRRSRQATHGGPAWCRLAPQAGPTHQQSHDPTGCIEGGFALLRPAREARRGVASALIESPDLAAGGRKVDGRSVPTLAGVHRAQQPADGRRRAHRAVHGRRHGNDDRRLERRLALPPDARRPARPRLRGRVRAVFPWRRRVLQWQGRRNRGMRLQFVFFVRLLVRYSFPVWYCSSLVQGYASSESRPANTPPPPPPVEGAGDAALGGGWARPATHGDRRCRAAPA